ncbi:MAG: FAD/NAD(P)-binding protein [Thermoleophilia bacterium]|nr:FAD/NAD(P)-binding protein [Thermoleophilia bacterium]
MTIERQHVIPTVAIVGGGAAGSLVALHVLRCAVAPVRVVLLDRHGSHGRGVAYANDPYEHRLNVPASRLATSADRPQAFVEWLIAAGADPESEPFATRAQYGTFLEEQLAAAATGASAAGATLECRAIAVNDVVSREEHEQLILDDGTSIRADAVVLALGPPTAPADPTLRPDTPQSFPSPWEPDALDAPAPGSTVLLRGAGLTAIDAALALLRAQPDLTVQLVSRTGELARAHAGGGAVRAVDAAPAPHLPAWLQETAPLAWSSVRAAAVDLAQRHAAAGGDERDLVDALRPHVTALWQRLGPQEQAAFLRSDLRAWEVRRHRMAPSVAARVAAFRASGHIQTTIGRVAAVRLVNEGYEVELRGAPGGRVVVQRIIDCGGFGRTDRQSEASLLHTLAARGRIEPDVHALGIRSDAEGRVLASSGDTQLRLAVIGALRRGDLWESTAIPELRSQAEQLARVFIAPLLSGAGAES